MSEPVCVNPNESLADLVREKARYKKKVILNNQLNAKLGMSVDRENDELLAKIIEVNKKIDSLEAAAKVPGQCIRIM